MAHWPGTARIRQWLADLAATFWLRPACMTLLAIAAAETLIWSDGRIALPEPLSGWVYAGGRDGARDLLATIAAASIGVAGTTFSITVAALSLASNQMGPRLLRNFARDPGNQYALGTFLATFAFTLVALRTVRGLENGGEFVPQLAVSGALLLAFACIGVLMWFLNHVATSINVSHVIALVHRDLAEAIERLPERPARTTEASAAGEPAARMAAEAAGCHGASAGGITAWRPGYLRALDDDALADWAERHDGVLRLRVRPGDFVFPGSVIGTVHPASLVDQARPVLHRAIAIGDSRSIEQDIEFAVRQLVEVALRALSPSLNDPLTTIAVLDRFGAALCSLARRSLPDGRSHRGGRLRLVRPAPDYAGMVDAMLHMPRQSGAASPPVMIRMLEVLAEVMAVERDPQRLAVLRRHATLAADAGLAAITDRAGRRDLCRRVVRLRRTWPPIRPGQAKAPPAQVPSG